MAGDSVASKTCKICGNQFEGTKCNPCATARIRAYRAAHPEKAAEAAARWRAKHPEKAKAGAKKYREEHRAEYAQKTAEWRQKNPERAKALMLEYRQKNAESIRRYRSKRWLENKDRLRAINAKNYLANAVEARAKQREYYKANREQIRLLSAAYYLRNIDRSKQDRKRWRLANPERRKAHHQNRRARKEGNGGKLSSGIVSTLLKLQRGLCACCAKPLGKSFHLDHIVPLALGGQNSDDNVQLLRQRCNNQKGAKHPVDFMQSRGFLL